MAKPTLQQLDWADQEMGVIIHPVLDMYRPDFENVRSKEVREKLPASLFTAPELCTDQWLAAASALGAKYAVLVANHSTGFSLWPTRANDYSVAHSPWRGGKGDVIANFVLSCEKYHIKPGLYYSTSIYGYYGVDTEVFPGSEEYRAFSRVVEKQLKEIWTGYGKLFEIWFDNGLVPPEKGGPDVASLLEKYQMDAVCFQGPPEHKHNLRWVGNERAQAPDDCWSTTNADAAYDGTLDCEAAGRGAPDGKYWWPAESDMGNRYQRAYMGGWSWKQGEQDLVYSTDELMDCYLKSVGRNTNFLLGMGIATNGLFEDTRQLELFGKRLRDTFSTPLAHTSGRGRMLEMLLPDRAFQYISMMEDITNGHAVRAFRLLLDGREIFRAECIGHKRIVPFNQLSGRKLTLEILDSCGDSRIRDLSVYTGELN